MASDIENRGPELVATNSLFQATALISIILRCYVRCFMVKAFGVDDWLMVVAAVFFTLYASFSTVGAHYGTGRHHADLETWQIDKALMCWWFCYLWYCLAMISSKVSIGWFLLRVTTSKLHTWIIYLAMLSTGLSGIVFFFVTLFQCSPISYFWNKDQPGKCVNIDVVIALAFLYSSFSVISDFVFAILPGVIVWNLQLHKKTKMLLFPLLAMGCVASSAVVVRFPFLPKLKEPDFLWNTVDIAIWSTVEQGLAITAGSLAALRPLIRTVGYRLGISSKPTQLRASDYGIASPRTPKSATEGYFNRRDAYTLSSVGCDGVVAGAPDLKVSSKSPSSGVFSVGFKRESKNTKITLTTAGDNESGEELHSPETWSKSSHQKG